MILDEIGITITTNDLPPYTLLAHRFIWLPEWFKWTRCAAWLFHKATEEYERCSLDRMMMLLDKTIKAGNAVLKGDNDVLVL